MIDNWVRSKITSHLGKRCVCGAHYNLQSEVLELNYFFNSTKCFCQHYFSLVKENMVSFSNVKVKHGVNCKYCREILYHLQKPIYGNNRKLKRYVIATNNPTNVFNVKLIFVLCPKCERKAVLQYKLSPILGK